MCKRLLGLLAVLLAGWVLWDWWLDHIHAPATEREAFEGFEFPDWWEGEDGAPC